MYQTCYDIEEQSIKIIKKYILQKCNTNEPWENEYGTTMKNCVKNNLCIFKSENDFHVKFKNISETKYFKILPSSFSLPESSYYWQYFDGCLEDNKIIFQTFPILRKNI